MTEEDRVYMAMEIGKIKVVLGTLITWIAQSSAGVISISDAKSLLKTLYPEETVRNLQG